MGLFFSRLLELLQSSEPARILMLGLDAAGKTTILYKLKLNENVCTIPTIGFNVETVQPIKGITFTVWDVGGQGKIRALWKPYFNGTEGLLFVVDSIDRERLGEAREELSGILESDEMRGVPVVVLANKQDLPNAMKPSDIIDGLGLRNFSDRKWHVQGTCAVNGEGIIESTEKLSDLVREFKSSNRR